MPYNEKLAERILERLNDIPKVSETKLMGGQVFVVNHKIPERAKKEKA